MGDYTVAPSRPVPAREDCWSEEATATLIEAWGRRHVDLNRGNLRQKDWQEVAEIVNSRHGHEKKARRSDVQCKNRIDTLKKKYKAEKARVSESNGAFRSSWPFYPRLDALIGYVFTGKKVATPPRCVNSPPMAVPLPYRRVNQAVVATPVVLPQKRPSSLVDDSYFRRNYSAVAAAAVRGEEDESENENENENDDGTDEEDGGCGQENNGRSDRDGEGVRQLARAIERFGEIYERMEKEKQKQMIDLEKQRMQFAKDLEFQRMQLFMDTQVQLQKMKRAKRAGSSDMYS